MIRSAAAALGLMLALAAAVPVRAEGDPKEPQPFELVRALRALQDEIARGTPEAHLAQQQLMADLPAKLTATQAERWKEPRNARAAIAYVLSGGDPRVLRKLLGLGDLPGVAADLAHGALAYAEGRDGEARAHLLGVDARRLDPGLAGAVALVQSALAAAADPGKASDFLDQARLLAPGTLVEEAALRRQMLLLPSTGQLGRLELLLTRYLHRFGKSYYARAFWRQLAAGVAGLEHKEQMRQLTRLAALSAGLGGDDRQDLYLAMAREGIARGKIDLVRFATGQVLQRTASGAPARLRAQVYEAAALVSTERFEQAVQKLAAIRREHLAREDALLIEAALSIAQQIRRPPPPDVRATQVESDTGPDERSRELASIGQSTVSRARALVASVDELLSGKAQ